MHPSRPRRGGAPEQAGPTTTREVERKVRVPEDFELPLLDVEGVAEVRTLEPVTLLAAYHDTADVRLIRWGATLRRREGGGDEGWHLKLPVEGEGPGVRDELGLPLDAGEVGAVPAAMADIVRPFAREAPLVHVSTVRTVRTPHLLLDAAGTPLAELVDDRVSVLEGGQVVRSFREVEVEAKVPVGADGSPVLDGVVERLVAHGGVPGTEGKAAAALGERAAAPPDVVVPPWPGAAEPAAAVVRTVLATLVRKLVLQDVRVRRDLPDAVHQMRVAARTLRSALREFRPLLDDEWARALRDELRWAAGALGDARDIEVLLARLESHATALPEGDAAVAVPALERWLREDLEDARQRALAELRSPRHVVLLQDLVAAVREPHLSPRAHDPATTALPPLVEKAWRRLRRTVRTLELESSAEDWHRARIHAKRARYTAESVAPVLGPRTKHLGQALERVTDLLGDLHDASVAQVRLRELAARRDADGITGYALGLLDAVEVERERQDREHFTAVWPEVRAAHRAASQ